jgi:ribosomal-protein-alanine N-acetyltransferase
MEHRFSVRPVQPSDIDGILAIERAGFGEWAWDRKLFAEYAATCGDLFLVVERGDKVVGYAITCITRRLLRARAELVSIAVSPSMRGKGAAKVLMSSVFRRLRSRGIPRIALTVKETNERARAFYEKYGFRRIRRVPGYYEDGEDGIQLQLEL